MEDEILVCIIEDDPIQLFLLSKYMDFLSLNKSVIIYNNGKDAYDNLKVRYENSEKTPDYILLDINMPIWDGWQFLDAFQKIPAYKETNVFILTSSENERDKSRAATYGLAQRYFVKPIQIKQLKEILSGNFYS